MPGYQPPGGCRIVVQRYPDDLQTLRTVLALPAGEFRHLLETWAAPARPKVQQHEFAGVISQAHRLAAEIGARELRRHVADCCRARRAAQRRTEDCRGGDACDESHEPFATG